MQYLGLGLGASSLIKNTRFDNIKDIKSYIRKCSQYKNGLTGMAAGKNVPDENGLLADPIGLRRSITLLSLKDRMAEFAFLGLRLQKGISKKEFRKRFGCEIESVYADVLEKHTKNGLLAVCDDRIYLTEQGIDVSNYVMADFLPDEEVGLESN